MWARISLRSGERKAIVTLDPGRVVADLPELRIGNWARKLMSGARIFLAKISVHLPSARRTSTARVRAPARGFRDRSETAFESRAVYLVDLGDVRAKDAELPEFLALRSVPGWLRSVCCPDRSTILRGGSVAEVLVQSDRLVKP